MSDKTTQSMIRCLPSQSPSTWLVSEWSITYADWQCGVWWVTLQLQHAWRKRLDKKHHILVLFCTPQFTGSVNIVTINQFIKHSFWSILPWFPGMPNFPTGPGRPFSPFSPRGPGGPGGPTAEIPGSPLWPVKRLVNLNMTYVHSVDGNICKHIQYHQHGLQ